MQVNYPDLRAVREIFEQEADDCEKEAMALLRTRATPARCVAPAIYKEKYIIKDETGVFHVDVYEFLKGILKIDRLTVEDRSVAWKWSHVPSILPRDESNVHTGYTTRRRFDRDKNVLIYVENKLCQEEDRWYSWMGWRAPHYQQTTVNNNYYPAPAKEEKESKEKKGKKDESNVWRIMIFTGAAAGLLAMARYVGKDIGVRSTLSQMDRLCLQTEHRIELAKAQNPDAARDINLMELSALCRKWKEIRGVLVPHHKRDLCAKGTVGCGLGGTLLAAMMGLGPLAWLGAGISVLGAGGAIMNSAVFKFTEEDDALLKIGQMSSDASRLLVADRCYIDVIPPEINPDV